MSTDPVMIQSLQSQLAQATGHLNRKMYQEMGSDARKQLDEQNCKEQKTARRIRWLVIIPSSSPTADEQGNVQDVASL